MPYIDSLRGHAKRGAVAVNPRLPHGLCTSAPRKRSPHQSRGQHASFLMSGHMGVHYAEKAHRRPCWPVCAFVSRAQCSCDKEDSPVRSVEPACLVLQRVQLHSTFTTPAPTSRSHPNFVQVAGHAGGRSVDRPVTVRVVAQQRLTGDLVPWYVSDTPYCRSDTSRRGACVRAGADVG